ncbi:helix-turn-helix transcriptional regulator [Methylibium sp. Root1272]|uniref:helix-turn-helix domain-containing protein n=1 Tax=Methylibium sp. Root1272 TaxID=1736441 RepID=UPI0012E71F9F|nr:helix-turn-helix transcriptional regulator [Methylibium sp. Root1272]
MDSSNWPTERKVKAGKGYAAALKELFVDPAYRARRRKAAVAANLALMIAQSDKTRTAVSSAAGMKLAQLSRQLSGEVNLTLDTVGRICDAVGWDFDVLFRPVDQTEASQPWQRSPINRATVLELVRSRRNSVGEAERHKLVCEQDESLAADRNSDDLRLAAA